MQLDDALSLIREIPDFPLPGILFKDITPLLGDAQALSLVTDSLIGDPSAFTHIVGIEARGFILASAMAARAEKGFIPLRKPGKLPHASISKSYGLEYGSDALEAHIDAMAPGCKVIIVDDVLATGGTLIAAIEIAHELGAEIVEVVVLFEISALQGRQRILEKYPNISVRAVVTN